MDRGTWLGLHWYQITVVIALLVVYAWTEHRKKEYRSTILKEFEQTSDQEQSDNYLQYYKRVQLLDVYRVIAIIAAVVLLVYQTDSNIIQGLAIATGAIIIVFQSLIMSFAIYRMLAANYQVGETVRVGQLGQGEIIYIKPLYFGLAGRNATGEHTGEFFLIPNNKVWENPIVKVDYHMGSYQKMEFVVYYRKGEFGVGFEEWIQQLTQFLDEYLPLRGARNVGHFKSYIGHKYKLDFEYSDHQTVKVTIAFVSKQKVGYHRKQRIVDFIENMRSDTTKI